MGLDLGFQASWITEDIGKRPPSTVGFTGFPLLIPPGPDVHQGLHPEAGQAVDDDPAPGLRGPGAVRHPLSPLAGEGRRAHPRPHGGYLSRAHAGAPSRVDAESEPEARRRPSGARAGRRADAPDAMGVGAVD